MKKFTYFASISSVIVALFAASVAPAAETPIKLTLAQANSPHVWIQPEIALHQGYFEEVGLDVEIVRFITGRMTLEVLIAGKADLATTAISPTIFASFQNHPLAILD